LVDLWTDKDQLQTHLEQSKENVETKINEQETLINKAIENDWRGTQQRIEESQHRRNRNVIEEIIKTSSQFRDEIGKVFYFLICLDR